MSSFSWTLPALTGSNATGPSGPLTRELGRLLGTDIFFENDYAITSSGDYVLLSGLENLRAAIYRRIFTRPGEYKFVPEYGVGLQDYVKLTMDTSTVDRLRVALTEQLLRERRIERVEHIAIDTTGDTIKIGLIIRAAGQELTFRPFTFTRKT